MSPASIPPEGSSPLRLPSLVLVAPDTDMGKTTCACLLLHAAHRAAERRGGKPWSYSKPIQSGEPDTERVRRICGDLPIEIHEAAFGYALPAAPNVAARAEGKRAPSLPEVLERLPPRDAGAPLLVESLGGPLSPIGEDWLQIDLLAALGLPLVLVSKNRVGAITGLLSSLEVCRSRNLRVEALLLLGPDCPGNADMLRRHGACPVFRTEWPEPDSASGYRTRSEDLLPLLAHLEAGNLRDSPGPDPVLRGIDHDTLWHPYSPLAGEEDRPVCIAARGEFLHLDTGEVLVDGISSWWTCIHGHAHPRLRAALEEAARRLDQVIFAGLTHEPAIRLAEELLQVLPDSFERVFFSDNGSTAVEVALKVVLGSWRRKDRPLPRGRRDLLLCLEGSYHGDTFGAMAVSRDPVFFGEWEEMLFDVIRIPLDPGALGEALDRHGEALAGLILEPLVQGAGGMRMQDPGELRSLCLRAREAGLPVIFDEVMTGFGRTGSLFAFQQTDFVPDVLCLAKGLSGGVLPLAATVVGEDLCRAWMSEDRSRMLFHGHSYTANPLACATGREGLRLLREPETREGIRRIREEWEGLRRRTWPSSVRNPRTLGTIFAYDLRPEGRDSGYLADLRREVIEEARKEGVFLRPLGNVVYAMPPYCSSRSSLERISEALVRIARNVR